MTPWVNGTTLGQTEEEQHEASNVQEHANVIEVLQPVHLSIRTMLVLEGRWEVLYYMSKNIAKVCQRSTYACDPKEECDGLVGKD